MSSDPMYAIVATVRVENPEEARKVLQTARVPLLKRAPGMVTGYWLEPIDGIGMSVIVFDTKEAADTALAYPVPLMPGVTPLTVELREVFASV
jgi:hypothetical protein